VLGVVLATLSYGTPSFSGGKPTLQPRGAEVWHSESQLLITQSHFPYGQAPTATAPQTTLSNLSPVYATLANGTAIQAEIHQQFGASASVKATESLDPAISSALPFVILTASAPAKSAATQLAQGAAVIVRNYVEHHQVAGKIPGPERIALSIIQSGGNTKLVEGHEKTVPILVFMAILIGVLALVFLKESAHPRVALETGRVSPEDIAWPEPDGDTPRWPDHEHARTG
ncbi:MAG: hypothetical protein ACLP1Q_03840, partial [Solirubrobacteraceae bacterium]